MYCINIETKQRSNLKNIDYKKERMMDMDIKKLLEDLKKCESLEEIHRCLLKYGFRLDDINDEYSGSVEMC